MHKKVRQEHNFNVPRELVYAVMYALDPEGLEARAGGTKKVKQKGHFTTKGPNWVHSVDGHDKLMGLQNSTFPLDVYGCIDNCYGCVSGSPTPILCSLVAGNLSICISLKNGQGYRDWSDGNDARFSATRSW